MNKENIYCNWCGWNGTIDDCIKDWFCDNVKKLPEKSRCPECLYKCPNCKKYVKICYTWKNSKGKIIFDKGDWVD
jgi:uncharacterized Zn finger protein